MAKVLEFNLLGIATPIEAQREWARGAVRRHHAKRAIKTIDFRSCRNCLVTQAAAGEEFCSLCGETRISQKVYWRVGGAASVIGNK